MELSSKAQLAELGGWGEAHVADPAALQPRCQVAFDAADVCVVCCSGCCLAVWRPSWQWTGPLVWYDLWEICWGTLRAAR